MNYLPYLGTLVLAGVAGHLLYRIAACIGRGEAPESARRLYERLHPRPVAEPMPPVLLELELARLSSELQLVRTSDAQGRATRMRAVAIAYDDALARCCESFGLDLPDSRRPLSAQQRLQAESQLLAAGASW